MDMATVTLSAALATGAADPEALIVGLRARRVVGAVRDGHLRLSVHLYNHEDDIDRVTRAITALPR